MPLPNMKPVGRADPLQPRRLTSAARCRARLGSGRFWKASAGGAWHGFNLNCVASDRAAAQAAACGANWVLRTPCGNLCLTQAALLSLLVLAGGLHLDADWPPPILEDMAHLALARMDPALAEALGGAVELLPPSVPRPDLVEPVPLLLTLLTLLPAGACESHSVGLQADRTQVATERARTAEDQAARAAAESGGAS